MFNKFSHRIASLLIALAIAFAGVTPALAAPPLNDNFVDAEAIDPFSLPFSATVDITDASNESGEPQICVSMDKSAWYSFAPSETMLVRADIQGSFDNSVMNVFQANGPGINNLSFRTCIGNSDSFTFLAIGGQTYYLHVGTIIGFAGIIQVNLEQIPPPGNDDFVNATNINSLPFTTNFDFSGATLESGEPFPSCVFTSPPIPTIWYTFSPSQDGSLSASMSPSSASPFMAVYSGTNFNDLTELGCGRSGNTMTFQALAGQTYYFQLGSFFEEMGGATFFLENTLPPVADFFFFPSDPSVFSTVQFCDNSFDPGSVGFQSMTWDFGDGATSTDNCAAHQYPADGDYTVQHSVTTFDGRTASTSQVVQVRTHDVAIMKIAAPRSGNVGQTKTITVSIKNNRYPETVRIELYRSVAGGGFEFIGFSTQFVPVRSGNRTSQFTFKYTFSPQDAMIGKVTFKAVVFIENANDALPADNEAISTPPTVVKGRISYP